MTLSRNDACWCGSGKKYKSCHLGFDEKLKKLKNEGYIVPPKDLFRTPEEIEKIRKSGLVTNKILDILGDEIKIGMSTAEIDDIVVKITKEHGATAAPLNYNGFPKSCCTSINEVVCHGIPSENEFLKDGDILNIDITSILDGYFSDVSRMYLIGNVSDDAKKLVDITKQSMYTAIETVQPYAPVNIIGETIEPFVKQYGYSVVRALGGHGVGKNFHDDPHVNHYRTKYDGMLLVPGMVLTIEPMINAGTYDVEILEDEWTVVTKDGKLSAQWERTVLITEDGAEILA